MVKFTRRKKTMLSHFFLLNDSYLMTCVEYKRSVAHIHTRVEHIHMLV